MNIVITIEGGCCQDCFVNDPLTSEGHTVILVDYDTDRDEPRVASFEPAPWYSLMAYLESNPKLERRIRKILESKRKNTRKKEKTIQPPSYQIFKTAYNYFHRKVDRYASRDETMIDLLADAMHHAVAIGVDFEECLRIARDHHAAETGEKE